jgi:hypothetical protein
VGLFTDKKEMKNWAIALGNACGGAKVTTELQLTKVDPDKVFKLTQQFVNEYNAQMMKAIQEYKGDESE